MEEPAEKVRTFLAERRLDLAFLLDPHGSASTTYGIRALPTNVLIDGDGVIRATSVGYRRSKFNRLKRQIRGVMAEKQ